MHSPVKEIVYRRYEQLSAVGSSSDSGGDSGEEGAVNLSQLPAILTEEKYEHLIFKC